MAVNKITFGLAQIALGAIESDGGMSTSLAPWGYTEQDSCQIQFADPEETDFVPEEIEDPIYVASKEGAKTVAFTIMDPGTDTLQNIFGGTVTTTGTAPNQVKTFNAPSTSVNIEKSIKITPKEGLIFQAARVKITASLDSTYSKNGLFTVSVKARILKPTKEDEKTYQFIDDPASLITP